MKTNSKFLIALAALAAASGPAHAICDGCVVGAISKVEVDVLSRLKDARDAITAGVATAQERVVLAITGATTASSAQAAKAAELMAESVQRAQSQLEQSRQDARYEVPDACAVLASTRAGFQDASRRAPSIGGGTGRGGGGGARRASGGVTPLMQESLDIAAGRVAAPSPELQAAKATNGACSSFAASGSLRGQTCVAAGYEAKASNGHPDADIRAETLFDGPQRGVTASDYRRKLTLDPDGAEKQAVEAYLRNLNTPIDLRQLKKGELQTDEGRQYMAFRDSYEARMSLAEKPSRALAASRMANATLIPVVQQMLTSDVAGQFTKDYLSKNYPAWDKKGISVDELYNLEGERRFMNRDWHLKMAGLSPEAHTKEQTTMMAVRATLLARLAEKVDNLSLVAGQQLGSQVRAEMIPQLITLHGEAAR